MPLSYHRSIIAASVMGFLLCMGLIVCGCASTKLGRGLSVGIGVAGVADLVTTHQAEDRGGVEWNRIMGDSELRRALLKAGGVGVVIGAAHLLEIKGKPILAHVVRAMAIGVWGFAAWHNHHVLRGGQ